MNAMTDLEKDLNVALENDLPGAKLRHEPFTRPAPAMPRVNELTPQNQLERFMESSAKMLATQRRNVIETESAYQIERIRLLDDYRVRIETLKNECADAVRALDQKHRANIADSQSLLDRLALMRGLD